MQKNLKSVEARIMESPKLSAARSGHARVVFVITIRAHFPEMYRTACGMLRNGKFEPAILFAGDEDFAGEFSLCKEAGLNYLVYSDTKKSEQSSQSKPSVSSVKEGQVQIVAEAPLGLRQRLKHWPVLGSIFQNISRLYVRCFVIKTAFICLPWHLNRLRKLRQSAKTILQVARTDIVVVPHIELGGILGCIVIEAKRLGIPSVVIPYTWIFRDEIMKALIGKAEYQTVGLISRWVAKSYPQWLFRGYLFRPPVQIVALEWLGFPTTHPWMADSIADAIALESEVMLRSYLADEVEASKCHVTGSASHDILALTELKARGMASSQADKSDLHYADSEFVLSFLPPDQTGNQMAGFEYPSYWDMLLFWIRTAMADDTIPVVFSLHPRMKSIKNSLLAQFPKLNVYDGDACELIPQAKFCVGQFGGMMRHAIACSKPVLYYDVFNYQINKNEFTSAAAVITVSGKEAFAETYSRFIADKTYFARLESDARVGADEWGKLDGKAVARIEELIASNCQ